MYKLLLIAGGGACGAVLRYALSGWTHKFAGESFPYGTLTVNVLGCLLIGLVAAVLEGPYLVREEYRVALLVGVLGAFTTFSTFGWETFQLANDGQFFRAGLNVLVMNVLGLAAVWFGYRLATSLWGIVASG